MDFKITPTTHREKKYMSAIWKFDADGGTAAVTPSITSILPKGAVIVEHFVENISQVTSAVTPTLTVKVGSAVISDTAVPWGSYRVANSAYVIDTDTQKITLDDRTINFLFSADLTGGSIAVTIGYFDPGDYINL
tara:strand:- start:91 stop:495 length:405 start_codon:yes stop_codon:yes gene_type:complete